MLVVGVALGAVPLRATTPAAPTAFGCSDPPIGAFVDAFASCEECESIGSQGASEGMWYSWHCRFVSPYYHLYVT